MAFSLGYLLQDREYITDTGAEHLRMTMKSVLNTVMNGPYQKHPPLHIHVLLQDEQPWVLSLFKDDTALPASLK
ncbi:hypothetical protein ILYODFUR_029643 [Ilyodon furcidens]|uniref:Uncharacterized protein n=1 Tax=Ilyodon furcidens TaxID=33524 RepID=A0ABV0V749_9TELE